MFALLLYPKTKSETKRANYVFVFQDMESLEQYIADRNSPQFYDICVLTLTNVPKKKLLVKLEKKIVKVQQ